MSANNISKYLQQLQWDTKYLSPLGNKVLETSNAIVVYCLYSQWEEMPTFFPNHMFTSRTSTLRP